MLKIKDDVNLKELEKYGFMKYALVDKKHYELNFQNGNCIKVNQDTRLIHYNQMSVANFIPNVIYDLIKDGLVEKV